MMEIKQIGKTVATAALLSSAMIAEAVTVSLDPASLTVLQGDQFSFDVLYDTEGANTVGGAFSVNFDSDSFDFVNVDFDAALPDDPAFRVRPDGSVSSAFNLGFGNFSGIEGSGKAAMMIFQANQTGKFDFILGDPLPGHDPFTEGATYLSAQVQVNAVPLPAAGLLMLSSLAGIGLITRRKPAV